MRRRYGAIFAEENRLVCAVGKENGELLEIYPVKITDPAKTMRQLFAYFDQFQIDAMGIGLFGPIEINPRADGYGHIIKGITDEWTGFDFLGQIRQKYAIPIYWTTDGSAAAYGEHYAGASKGTVNSIYMNLDDRISTGAIVGGEILAGLSNPEMAHIASHRYKDDQFAGICPYHGDCLEGLASAVAIEKRWGASISALADRTDVWEMEAFYVAHALLDYTLILSPDCIVLGGKLTKNRHLISVIKKTFSVLENGYIFIPPTEQYLVCSALGEQSGLIGALLLAERAWRGAH